MALCVFSPSCVSSSFLGGLLLIETDCVTTLPLVHVQLIALGVVRLFKRKRQPFSCPPVLLSVSIPFSRICHNKRSQMQSSKWQHEWQCTASLVALSFSSRCLALPLSSRSSSFFFSFFSFISVSPLAVESPDILSFIFFSPLRVLLFIYCTATCRLF